METKRIVLDLSTEAADMLDRHAAEDNCTPSAVVGHLVTGRALVKDGHLTVPELVQPRGADRESGHGNEPASSQDK